MGNSTSYTTTAGRQRGAVLVISLLMLLVMTIIGVTAMQGTTLEEKMAGNQRDMNLAFQAAESALRDGEQFVEGLQNTDAFGTGGNGLYDEGNFPDVTTGDPFVIEYSGTIEGVVEQPRYFIEKVSVLEGAAGSMDLGRGYGKTQTTGDVTNFRITARGVGGTENSTVVLRSFYGRIMPAP